MDQFDESNYGHGHRAFLQAFLARGTLTYEEAQPIIAAIKTADSNGEQAFGKDDIEESVFQEYIDVASQAASVFDYEIRTTIHQVSKQRVWALVNTTSDPQTQLATTFTADELAFINRLLHDMFGRLNTPRMEMMAIDSVQTIKLARPSSNRRQTQTQTMPDEEGESSTQAVSDKGLKHSEVDAVVASLVDGGWLEKSRHGFYSLSTRGLLELRPWLTETFNDPEAEEGEWQPIKFCEACKDIVTVGLRCSDPSCTFRIHDICEEAFWRARRDKKCPRCSRDWEARHYVGERALTTTSAYKKRKSQGRRNTGADDLIREHDAGDENVDEAADDDDGGMES